jgi:hypothetical protein
MRRKECFGTYTRPAAETPRTFPAAVSATATAFDATSESLPAVFGAAGTTGSNANTPAVLSQVRLPISMRLIITRYLNLKKGEESYRRSSAFIGG